MRRRGSRWLVVAFAPIALACGSESAPITAADAALPATDASVAAPDARPTVDAPHPADAAGPTDAAAATADGAPAPSTTLPGVGGVDFPPGALPSGAAVALERDTSAGILAAFDDGAGSFDAWNRVAHALRITTGAAAPSSPATVELEVPAGFTAGAGREPRVFARIYAENETEALDAFQPLEALPSPRPGVVAALLPPWAFTAARAPGGPVEALVLLAAMPVPAPASRPFAGFCANPASACPVRCMRTPLLRTLRATQRANLSPPEAGAFHPGVDLRAEDGLIDAVAVGDGTVLESRFSANSPAGCNRPTNCPNKGMGETVLLLVPGVGRVRYMHLSTGSRTIADCCTGRDGLGCQGLEPCSATVAEGQVLGQTGNTGYSSGSHLHLELIVDGARVDPAPCMLPPDYKGEASTRWQSSGDGASFDLLASADVTYRWSEMQGRYEGEGTWRFQMSSTDPMCTSMVSRAEGPIAPEEASLSLGGLTNELLKADYFLPGDLKYVATGGALQTVRGQYDCRDAEGNHHTGSFDWSIITWLPFIISDQGLGFFTARQPFEDFEETDIPDFPGSLHIFTSSWKLSARVASD